MDEEDALVSFKTLWREECGEEIDDARAVKEMQRLLTLVRFAVEPLPEVGATAWDYLANAGDYEEKADTG